MILSLGEKVISILIWQFTEEDYGHTKKILILRIQDWFSPENSLFPSEFSFFRILLFSSYFFSQNSHVFQNRDFFPLIIQFSSQNFDFFLRIKIG